MTQSQEPDDLSTDAGAVGSHQWEASYDYAVNGRDIFDWKCRDCGRRCLPTKDRSTCGRLSTPPRFD